MLNYKKIFVSAIYKLNSILLFYTNAGLLLINVFWLWYDYQNGHEFHIILLNEMLKYETV